MVFVSYEALAKEPDKTVRSMCRKLGMPEPEEPLSLPMGGYHYVGGNPAAHQRRDIVLDESWKKVLNKTQKKTIEEHSDVMTVYASMVALTAV
jgi:hypothetical protein